MPIQTKTAIYFATIVSIGGFIFGFDATVISGVIGFVTVEFNLSDLQQGLVVGAPTFGGILGALTVNPLADYFGRKRILILLALVYLASAILSALSQSYDALILARAVGGYAFASLGLAPIYISETAPAEKRGTMVSVNQLNIVIGFSVAYFANYYILNLSQNPTDFVKMLGIDSHTWRWMLGLEALPATLWLFLLFLIPESPRWLMLKGRTDQAKEVLAKITLPSRLDHAYDEILTSTKKAGHSIGALAREFIHPKMRLPLAIGIVIGIAQQTSGINAVYFYAPTIFEQSGMGTNAAFVQAIWIGLVNVAFTVLAMMLIDKFGRRPMLIIGLTGIILSLMTVSYGFNKATYSLNKTQIEALKLNELTPMVGTVYDSDVIFKRTIRSHIGDQKFRANESQLINIAMAANTTLILAGIMGFVASFAFSIGPIMWILFAEIFPNHLRGLAMAFVGLFNTGSSFAVQFTFPYALTNLGSSGIFLVYALFSIVGLALVIWLLPETKGRSLEELEQEFADHAAGKSS